jgi:hypothetical protein
VSFWNIPAPYPCGRFDKDADLAFTFDFASFVSLAGTALTLTDVGVIDADPKLTITKSVTGTKATLRIKRSGVAATLGDRMKFTLRPVLSDLQQDDWTYMLQLVEN